MKQPNKRSLKYVYVHDFHHLSPMWSHLQWGQAVRVANVQRAVEIIEGARTRSDLNILNMPTCLLWMASALGQPWASCLMFLDGLTLAKRSDSGTSSISTRSFQKGLHTRSVNRINRFWMWFLFRSLVFVWRPWQNWWSSVGACKDGKDGKDGKDSKDGKDGKEKKELRPRCFGSV